LRLRVRRLLASVRRRAARTGSLAPVIERNPAATKPAYVDVIRKTHGPSPAVAQVCIRHRLDYECHASSKRNHQPAVRRFLIPPCYLLSSQAGNSVRCFLPAAVQPLNAMLWPLQPPRREVRLQLVRWVGMMSSRRRPRKRCRIGAQAQEEHVPVPEPSLHAIGVPHRRPYDVA